MSVGVVAAKSEPRIMARLRKERPFVDPNSRWPPKGGSRPRIEFSVGLPSSRWALLGVQQHEFAVQGHDWAPVQMVGLMSSGNRRTVRLDLSDDVGSPVGLTTVSLRLYFWQQSRVPLVGALSRSFYFDVRLTSQAGLVDVRPMGSDWLCRLDAPSTSSAPSRLMLRRFHRNGSAQPVSRGIPETTTDVPGAG